MLFGLAQYTQFGPAHIRFVANYDNLEFSINRRIPESGSTLLLLFGSIGALLVFQRRFSTNETT